MTRQMNQETREYFQDVLQQQFERIEDIPYVNVGDLYSVIEEIVVDLQGIADELEAYSEDYRDGLNEVIDRVEDLFRERVTDLDTNVNDILSDVTDFQYSLPQPE